MAKFRLDYRDGFLCVRRESGTQNSGVTAREWLPVREASEADVATLVGKPLRVLDAEAGLYVDEDGEVFEVAGNGAAKPIATEEISGAREKLKQLPAASHDNGGSTGKRQTHALRRPAASWCKGVEKRNGSTVSEPPTEPVMSHDVRTPEIADPNGAAIHEASHRTLRHKLAEVRRRIGYIQKRGFNERNNYSYVTAADLAGAVGDILAELGVVIVPRLESIIYEPSAPGRGETSRAAQVVMAYTFTDVDSGEEITAKVAGQGLDAGDKAPYKAMTGALKYALLQSFLLATGDDPEDERITSANGSERLITADEIRQLRSLIEETGTELDRVLSYYKVSSLEEMRESNFRRAIELLNRKRAKKSQGSQVHAQD